MKTSSSTSTVRVVVEGAAQAAKDLQPLLALLERLPVTGMSDTAQRLGQGK